MVHFELKNGLQQFFILFLIDFIGGPGRGEKWEHFQPLSRGWRGTIFFFRNAGVFMRGAILPADGVRQLIAEVDIGPQKPSCADIDYHVHVFEEKLETVWLNQAGMKYFIILVWYRLHTRVKFCLFHVFISRRLCTNANYKSKFNCRIDEN